MTNGSVYKTMVTVLLSVITLLLSYFAVESRVNRDEITKLKISRATESERLKNIEEDIEKILAWVERQQEKE